VKLDISLDTGPDSKENIICFYVRMTFCPWQSVRMHRVMFYIPNTLIKLITRV